jgi:hypothetical protein
VELTKRLAFEALRQRHGIFSGFPVPGQELVDPLCRMILKAGENVSEPCERSTSLSVGLSIGVYGGGAMAAFVRAGGSSCAGRWPPAAWRARRHRYHAEKAIVEEAADGVPAIG